MQLARCKFMSRLTAILGIVALFSSTLIGQTASQTPPDAPKPQARQFDLTDYSKPYKHFPNPVGPYIPHAVPSPNLSNTPRLSELMRDGKIVLSLDDAIALALENNLDLAIARYNLNIADVDILRAKAGSSIRGVNTGVVQGTPGGGVGGIGGTSSGAGAGGTTTGAGGAGAGSSGIVTSTSGVGSAVPLYDPVLTGTLQFDHNTFQSVSTFANAITKQNSTLANFGYQQGFMSGTNLTVALNNTRATTSSIFQTTNPSLSSSLRATVTQHILQGFGFLPNTRFIRIAKNNRNISDVAFRLQVITTVNQIQNIYWDLVNAYENVKVQDESMKLAQKTLSDNKKQVEIGTLAPIEVVRAQSVVATNEQSLIVAKTNLELQQLLMKNALSRTLVDPALAEAEVIPSSTMALPQQEPVVPIQDLINTALSNRAELSESRIDLTNRQITNKSARNALLPTLDAFVYYQGSGVGGVLKPGTVPCPPINPPAGCTNVPPSFQNGGPVSYSSTLDQLVNSTAPDKGMGLTLTIPIRNRSAQADQIQAQLEYRQAEMRLQQLENQVRIEVRNAQFTVQQNRAAVESAQAAVALARESLDAEEKKYALGASTTTLVLQAQRDMAQAQSNQVTAMSNYQKSRVELDRVTGSTLDHNGILMDDAVRGQVSKTPHVPYATPRSDAQTNTTQTQQ